MNRKFAFQNFTFFAPPVEGRDKFCENIFSRKDAEGAEGILQLAQN